MNWRVAYNIAGAVLCTAGAFICVYDAVRAYREIEPWHEAVSDINGSSSSHSSAPLSPSPLTTSESSTE